MCSPGGPPELRTLEEAPALLLDTPGDVHALEAVDFCGASRASASRNPRPPTTPTLLAWGAPAGVAGLETDDPHAVDVLGECLRSARSASTCGSVRSSRPTAGQLNAAGDRAAAGPCWFWEHKTGWRKYGDGVQEQIETAFATGYTKVRVKTGKGKDARPVPMEIFFEDMIQWDPISQNTRKVKRVGHLGCWFQLCQRLQALSRWLETGAPTRESFEAYKERMEESRRKLDKESGPGGRQAKRRFGHRFSTRTGLNGDPTLIARLVGSRVFVVCTSIMILLNTAFIAIELDFNDGAGLITDADSEFLIPEYIFCIFFLAEIFLRMLALQWRKDCLRDSWFMFDALLVVQMMGESMLLPALALVVPEVEEIAGGEVVAQLRLLRLLRIVRVMRTSPELFNLIRAMVVTLPSVFFTLVLIFMLIFVFGIVYSSYSKDLPGLEGLTGSVSQSMWTLLLHGTLLDSPADTSSKFYRNDANALGILFPVFIFASSFCLLNVLIGIVVEVVSAMTSRHKEKYQVRFLKEHLLDILWAYDKNNDECIGPEEFDAILTNPDVAHILAKFGMNLNRVLSLKQTFFDDHASLTFAQLLNYLMRLRGNPAEVADIVDAREHVRRCDRGLRTEVAEVARARAGGAAPCGPRRPTGARARQLLDRLDRMEELCAPSAAEGELRASAARLERAALRLRPPSRAAAGGAAASPRRAAVGASGPPWAAARGGSADGDGAAAAGGAGTDARAARSPRGGGAETVLLSASEAGTPPGHAGEAGPD